MRNALFVLFFFLVATAAYAQCSYYYLQNNKTVTFGMFDKKGKEDGKYVYKVSDLTSNGGTTSATIQSEIFDKKGKSLGGGKGTMQCKDGMLMMDMNMLLSPQQTEQFKDAKMEGKAAFMEYPASLSVGQTLPDGSFDMDITMNNGMAANLSIQITGRKVEAKEKITTPAGSWEAFKINYESKTIISMGIPIPIKTQITEWFVPGFGMIKNSTKWGTQELLSIE